MPHIFDLSSDFEEYFLWIRAERIRSPGSKPYVQSCIPLNMMSDIVDACSLHIASPPGGAIDEHIANAYWVIAECMKPCIAVYSHVTYNLYLLTIIYYVAVYLIFDKLVLQVNSCIESLIKALGRERVKAWFE